MSRDYINPSERKDTIVSDKARHSKQSPSAIGMQEILLLKCENTIYANRVIDLLSSHGIASREHNENMDPIVGAYGAISGIAIYVFEKDYGKALNIVAPIIQERDAHIMCPRCGCEDIKQIVRKHDCGTTIMLIGLLLILIPVIYIALPHELGLHVSWADDIAIVMIVLGLIVMAFASRYCNNYECQKCGHRFQHRK